MATRPLELEGTWEEILAHAEELQGRRVRLTILSGEAAAPPASSTARALLQFAGTWAGDDLEESLRTVYESRRPTVF